jgi:hypothetical protein
MRIRHTALCIVLLMTSVPAMAESPVLHLQPPPNVRSAVQDEYDSLDAELQKLQESLPAKKNELDQLRRKWTRMKGRTPAPKEIAEFEKKLAKGQVSATDNPYVNKSSLGAPGLAREAYYKKLDEIKTDEALVGEIRKKLDALSLKAGRVEVPMKR